METLGIIAVAGVVAREITQLVVKKLGWEDSDSIKRLVSVGVAVGVAGVVAATGLREYDEALIAGVWAASWAAHTLKQFG